MILARQLFTRHTESDDRDAAGDGGATGGRRGVSVSAAVRARPEVASRSAGDRAYVLLDTNAGSDRPYLYGVVCQRVVGDGWVELGSSNGGDWSGEEDGLGLLSFWDEAPPNADRVRVTHRGVVFEEAVENGAYLFAWFNEPPPSDWPELTWFRVAGQWIKQDVAGRAHPIPGRGTR